MNDRFDKYYKLKNIIRYNTTYHITKENVAEHSFYVALISLKLCEEYNIDEDTTNKCVIKALLHDLPEMELNDITHDTKEKLNLRKLLKSYEDDYYKQEFNKQFELMSNGTELINTIVDLADAYSVIQFSNLESNLGNKTKELCNIKKEINNRCRKLTEKLEKILEGKK